MAESPKPKRARHPLRTAFRWCRIVTLLFVAVVIASFLWANVFGLPGWATAEIQKELRRRSIDLEFAKLRLKGFRHLIANNVRLKSAEATNSPSLTVREAEFLIDYQQLRSGNLSLSGVRLVSGTLLLPLSAQGNRSVIVSNINADVFLLPGDTIQVANLSAETLGARAKLSGELKRYSKFRFLSSTKTSRTADWQRPLAQVLEVAEQLQFESPPELSVALEADGGNVTGARTSVILRSGTASSRWGKFASLELSSAIAPTQTNNSVRGNFASRITDFRTDFGSVDSLIVEGETLWARDMELLLTNLVRVSAEKLDSKWFRSGLADASLSSSQASTNAPIRSTFTFNAASIESLGVAARTNSLGADLEHPLPFPTPAAWLARFFFAGPPANRSTALPNLVKGTWRAESAGIKVRRAELDSVQLDGSLTITNQNSDRSLGVWRILAGLQTPWEAKVTNIHSGEIAIGSIMGKGQWKFPRLDLMDLKAELHGGSVNATGAVDVTTRKVGGEVKSNFDYEKIAILFDKPVQQWLAQFSWREPPTVESTVRFELPQWTNWSPSLRSNITTTMELAGRFEGAGQFRGVPLDGASSHFGFSNYVWTLPDLLLRRPEGEARISYTGNVTNADFACTVESRIDPAILKSVLPKEQQPALTIVKFTEPPLIRAELKGNWDDETKLGVRAFLAATNFFVKEQAFTDIAGNALITNGLIYCTNVIVHRGKEETRAPYLRIDLPGEVMFVTNLVSTIDPWIAMSLVGEDAYNAIDPYRFASTPTVGVNGIVPLRHWSKADLHFEVAGNDFSYWRFHLPALAGHVHWRSNEVSFSNVVASFYGGKARWSGRFVIDPRKGEDYALFSFAGYTTNTDVGPLVADITRRTNEMEGTLHGELIITSASTANDRSWNGYGSATIEDGYLWSTPLFGVFTPILDGIAPGLGTSRMSSGSGTFTIRNSVVETRDMQVRAAAFRLAYKGTVDLEGKLDATAEAMIFRDAWVVGKLFSTALWPVSKAFEAKISGTLDAPKTKLRYVPKFLLAPFRALNAIGAAARKNPPQNSLQQPEKTVNSSAEPAKP